MGPRSSPTQPLVTWQPSVVFLLLSLSSCACLPLVPSSEVGVLKDVLVQYGYPIPGWTPPWDCAKLYFLNGNNDHEGARCDKAGHVTSLVFAYLKNIPKSISALQRLNSFVLFFGTEGPLPAGLFNLTGLQELDIQSYGGRFPGEAIGNLVKLSRLILLQSKLQKGSLPSKLWTLTELKELDISQNSVKGSITDSLGKLSRLSSLRLSENKLQGSFPSSLWTLTELVELDMSKNSISGRIPGGLGKL